MGIFFTYTLYYLKSPLIAMRIVSVHDLLDVALYQIQELLIIYYVQNQSVDYCVSSGSLK